MMVPSLLKSLRQIAAQLLVQVAQIHFQRSALTGLAMLAALASISGWAAAGAATASVAALVTARLLRLDGATAATGLFGYNASLTGAGLLSLYAPSPGIFAYLIAVSAISAAVSARWVRWGRLPALTLQFVLAMWGAAALGEVLGSRVPLAGCDGFLGARWACGIGQTEKPPAKPVGSFASRSRSKRLVSRCHLPASTQIGNRGHLVPAHSTRALLLAKLTARISRATPD